MRTHSMAAVVTLFAWLGFSQASFANDADKWQFEITPYLLAAGMEGTAGVHGHTADIDVSFSDILDKLDSGFMGLFTAQKGPWTLALEGVYMNLEAGSSNTVTGPGGVVSRSGKLDITNKMYIAQGSVGYRLLDDKTKLDVLGALRYTELKVEMDVKVSFTRPPFGGSKSEEGSDSWIDAVVGVRALHPVSDEVSLFGYTDIGTGGSDLTYQVMVGANWEFSEGYTAKLGYRYLYWDYEDDGTVWDVTAAGPYLGLGIRF